MALFRRHPLLRLLLLPFLALALVAGAACDDETAGPEEGADVGDITEDEGDLGADADELGDDEVFEDAESFVGEQVTVSANVSEIITDRAFRIAGEDIGGEGLLVFSAQTMPELDNEDVVQVTGTVRVVQVETFEEDFGFGFTDEFAEFEGEHAIAASSVEILDATPEQDETPEE